MNQSKPIQTVPALTNALLQDLADPRMAPWDICENHALTLDELTDLLDSPEFRRIADSLAFTAHARMALIAPAARQLAMNALIRIVQQEPQTRAHAETIRKATTTLLRTGRPDKPKSDPHAESPDHPRPSRPTLTTIVAPPDNEARQPPTDPDFSPGDPLASPDTRRPGHPDRPHAIHTPGPHPDTTHEPASIQADTR